MKFWERYAFTLIELMVVVVILGIIAAFAIPNYSKAMERSHEKQILLNMQAIASAQVAYKARYGFYWPYPLSGNVGIAQLNPALQLNIVPGNDIYGCCSDGTGVGYVCYGSHNAGGTFKWQLTNYENYGSPVKSLSTNQGISNNGACCDSYYPSNDCPTIPFDRVNPGFSGNGGICQ
jgi:prepilin-type N-terminal cleavage/methylation domain-containing protein